MNDLSEDFERLRTNLRKLESTVEALEQRLEEVEAKVGALELPAVPSPPVPSPESEATASAVTSPVESPVQPGSLFSVLGKALLGIAGAYVLRAVEESNVVPRLLAAVAGILYAFLWLIWAARARTGPRMTNSLYAGTSALILAPMLWELTLRFAVWPAAAAAIVVCVFALGVFALTWKQDAKPVVRVVSIATCVLAIALAVASQALLPFVAALLLLTAVCEFVPGCGRQPEIAAMFSLAADAAIWILIYVYSGGQTSQAGFPELTRAALLAPGLALLIIFAVSVGINTVFRARPITAFQAIQTVVAFLLAAVSLANFAQPHGVFILGVACLILSAAGYAAVFAIFARAPDPRNRTVFAAWSAALLLAGSFLCLPQIVSPVLLAAAAPSAAWLSRRERWAPFALYSMVFLLAASAASGPFAFVASALAGRPGGAPAAGVWLIAGCAPLCYMLARPSQVKTRVRQVWYLGFAAIATGTAAALLVDGMVALTALRVIPGPHHVALIRTIVLCAAALALVYAGAHWRRGELTWLGYATLALLAIKLIAEDLRHGHLAYIAGSIFLVAFTLIAAPRAARARQKS